MCRGSVIDKRHTSLSSSVNNDIAKINVVDIPWKVHLPKVASMYAPTNSYDNVKDSNFIFKQYGKAVFCSASWNPGVRDDIISFDASKDSDIPSKLYICEKVTPNIKEITKKLMTNYWDYFAEEGIKRPILGFEICYRHW